MCECNSHTKLPPSPVILLTELGGKSSIELWIPYAQAPLSVVNELTNQDLGSRVVHADSLQDGRSIVGHLNAVTTHGLEDLVLRTNRETQKLLQLATSELRRPIVHSILVTLVKDLRSRMTLSE